MTIDSEAEEYDGLQVTEFELVLQGSWAGLSRAFAVAPFRIRPGQPVDILIRTIADGPQFKVRADHEGEWKKRQYLSVDVVAIVDAEFANETITAQKAADVAAEQQAKAAKLAKKGVHPLPGTAPVRGVKVVTDSSGNVLTPKEVAEIRGQGGEVIETMVRHAVVIFANGERHVWPDDFVAGASRPNVGDEEVAIRDAVVHSVVVELQDMETGDPILPPDSDVDAAAAFGFTEGGGRDELTADGAGESEQTNAATGSPDSDGWEDPDPATTARLAAADVDPLIVDFLAQSTQDIKLQVPGQMSRQFLNGALDAEMNGPNKPRPAVVAAIKSQIAGL